MRIHRTPVTVATLALAAGLGTIAGATMGTGSHAGAASCTDPATGDRVVPGDAILNNGRESVCTDGTLITVTSYGQQLPSGRAFPPGFHWAWSTPVRICGKLGPQQVQYRPVIVWRGRGDSSALYCPDPPHGNGSVHES